MDESYRDLIVRGIAAAKVNDKKEARFYLEWVLRLEPPIEQRVDAWFWLSEVSDDPQQKRNFLEEVLCYQPGHQPARRSLAILDGRLDPSEIIDPVHLPAEGDAGHQPLHPQRYDCPHCGGRMVFQPDGRSLICEYCNGRRAIANPVKQEKSQDFTVAMATVRGHKIPVNTHSFECKACGAIFLL